MSICSPVSMAISMPKCCAPAKIVNTYDGLVSREKPGITERTVRARAGAGGAYFKFTVGDGTVNIRRAAQ